MITLDKAQKAIEEISQHHPAAQVRLVEAETLPPGWVWLCWGDMKIKPVQKGLWDSL